MQTENPWLSRFAKLLVAATFCLIFLGGMVTSVNAGLSVPDWPTSYGYNMFTFPVARWVGGIFFEHTHRLLGSCVGLLTTLLAAWIWRNRWALPVALAAMAASITGIKLLPVLAGPENAAARGVVVIWSFAAAFVVALLTTERDRWRYGKPWLQWLGVGAFLLVCVQGTLGGLRVTEVSTVLAMVHACTAQAFLCLTVIMAAALSPRWDEQSSTPGVPAVRAVAWTLVAAIYCQLMIGAVVRHLHAGLSIPTFPLAFGMLIPPMLNVRVAIHFAHRVGALVVTLLAIALAALIFKAVPKPSRLRRSVIGFLGTLALQVVLGAYVIWSRRDPVITSLHVVNGAVVLGKALFIALLASKAGTRRQPEARSLVQYEEAHA